MAPTIDAANNAIAISVFTFGFFFLLVDVLDAPGAQKNRRPSSGGGKFRGDFLVREIALPHIDPCGSRHLAVSNDRLPDSVYRIAPDAT
jgi:hypothetical protein